MEKYTHDIGKMKQNRLMHFQIGLIVALIAALACVNFTSEIHVMKDDLVNMEVDPEIPVVRTSQEKKVSPPPPKIEVKPDEIILEDLEFEEEPEPEVEPTKEPVAKQETTTKAMPVKAPVAKKKTEKKEPKPPVIVPEPVVDEGPEIIVDFVEKMPRFKLPKDKNASEDDIKRHSDAAMINYINKKIKYPAIARENGIEGTVVVKFIVEKDGEITQIEVLRDPGGGCGAEAKKVVENMPKWERIGRQNGRRVRVYFTMPIKFQLN